MKKQKDALDVAVLPRATLLFRALRTALEGAERSGGLSYDRLSKILSIPRTTLGRWTHGESAPSVECILQLFERLPTPTRAAILAQVCRLQPAMDHPSLAHDPAAVARLVQILASPGIINFVGQNLSVTFVLTAVAHSMQLPPYSRTVQGLDENTPSWFVPAFGLVYGPFESPEIAKRLDRVLRDVAPLRGAIIIFNVPMEPRHLVAITDAAERNSILLAPHGQNPHHGFPGGRLLKVFQKSPGDRILLEFS